MSYPEIIVGFVVLATLLLFVGSGAIWVWASCQLWTGQPILKNRFRSDFAPIPGGAVFLVLAYIAAGLWSLLSRGEKPEFNILRMEKILDASVVEGIALTLIFTLILISVSPRQTGRYRLGFRGDQRIRQVIDGVLGFVASIAPVFIVIVLTYPFRSPDKVHPFLKLINDEGFSLNFIVACVAAVLIAPIKEELMFRVILQSWLVRKVGVNWAIIGTAVIFAAVHGFPDALGLLPLALILGVVYHRRRSFISIVIIHALFNAFNLGLTLFANYAQQVFPTEAL